MLEILTINHLLIFVINNQQKGNQILLSRSLSFSLFRRKSMFLLPFRPIRPRPSMESAQTCPIYLFSYSFVINPGISLLRIPVPLYCSSILSDPCNYFYSCPSLFGPCTLPQIFLFQYALQRHFQLLSLVDLHVLICVLSSHLFQIGHFSATVLLFRSCLVPLHLSPTPRYLERFPKAPLLFAIHDQCMSREPRNSFPIGSRYQ